MKKAAFFSIGVLLCCMGCSAIAEEDRIDGQHFSGTIILLVADNFEKQTAQIIYELLSDEDGRTYSLHFSDNADMSKVISGTRVEIVGHQDNGRINVDTLRIIALPEGKE